MAAGRAGTRPGQSVHRDPREKLSMSTKDTVYAPGPGNSLERVLPTVLEFQGRPGDEVTDGRRNQDLGALGQCGDPGSDVHADASDRVPGPLHLASVQTGPDLDAEVADGVSGRQSASDGPDGTVERGQEAIARRVDLPAPESSDER